MISMVRWIKSEAVLNTLRSTQPYQNLLSQIRQNQTLEGLALPRAARLPVMAALHADLQVPMLLLTSRMDHALTLYDELSFWSPGAVRMLFPEPNPLFYEQAAWGSSTRRDRLQALTILAQYHLPGSAKPALPPLIVTPARALMARSLPRRDFLKASRLLRVGQVIQPELLLRSWVDTGYQTADIVTEQGQFSRRGGILDIWPIAESLPYRLEFFGDEVDTLRQFDPASQRTARQQESLLITPAREFLPAKAADLGLSVQGLSEYDLPRLHPAVSSLLDYLPQQAIVLVDDLDIFQATVSEVEEQSVKIRSDYVKEGLLAADFPIPYLTLSEIQDNLAGQAVLELGRSSAVEPSPLAQVFSPGMRFGGRLKPFIENIGDLYTAGERLVIVSRQVPRLRELWIEQQAYLDTGSEIPVEFLDGTLSEGWSLTPPSGIRLHLLTDSEIFGWERPQPRQRQQPVVESPEMAYADLQSGDWVVHVDHGIGRYIGLVRRSLEGLDREFLAVAYEGGDQLFVPIHQADRLTRYIGPDNHTPSSSRLGSAEWTLSKQRVRAGVENVAKELLDLYAQRQVARGHSFSADTPWQTELEASFPYIETEDQLSAITQVKQDMESIRPMDRLLCGDVGYGKTEVALRAAFKSVMDGKQVAVLVPTTVLAQQHYDTFCQRLVAYPVVVEMLSRFRSPREQDAILRRLARGEVDMIIGTHRLIQSDVEFKDLGLVIIDEEQRFGVTHKEHLKQLRREVDVLTLTATPIPRTLYMALTGARDISTINTPPEERLPIVTHVGGYSPNLVRQSVLRELERGGQIFFVHNRVQTIPAMLAHLNRLVPEARIGVGHGQMPEHELEAVMHRFTHGEIDILLCTSIIESGLDIPNANTLIVDRADTFGLAQLYQLRGRVGRGAQRAYAYFFRHKKKPPTPEGEERLEIIAENNQLGAGYSIAMRDLEMRGAGEMLGTRQHGYIAQVGFHLYTRLLSQAVRQQRMARGLPAPEAAVLLSKEGHIPVNVELPLSVGIPVEYVPDQNMRLKLYRRLADLQSEVEIDAMVEEFIDRFGSLPEMVSSLFFQMKVKLRSEAAGLASVSIEGDQLVLRYPPLPEGITSRSLPNLGGVVRTGKNAYWVPYSSQNGSWRQQLLEILTQLIDPSYSLTPDLQR
jgi:transcription-repair coupling factor (superfamily II helicase)